MIFKSYADAEEQVKRWKREFPEVEFAIRQAACGNKAMWEIVQTNRFSET